MQAQHDQKCPDMPSSQAGARPPQALRAACKHTRESRAHQYDSVKSPLLSRIQSPKLRVTRVPSTGRVTGVCQRAADISLYDRPAMAYCRQCHSSRNTGIQYRHKDHCVGGEAHCQSSGCLLAPAACAVRCGCCERSIIRRANRRHRCLQRGDAAT